MTDRENCREILNAVTLKIVALREAIILAMVLLPLAAAVA